MVKFRTIEVLPVLDSGMRDLCAKPYPNHPKGCPNYGKRDLCPPKCPSLRDTLNLCKPVYAAYAAFNLGQHVENMYKRHPKWTYRQAACCLYWQGSVRSKLKMYAEDQKRLHPGTIIVSCPEGAGVNVTETMSNAGVKLEWPPKNITRMIYFLGRPKKDG